MSRRAVRNPRLHWVALGVVMLLLFIELCLNGYVGHVGAEGAGPQPLVDTGSAPAEITAGGPVQRIDGQQEVRTSAMPPGVLALTFDDGPDPRWTPRILEVLRRHHARATFFVLGSNVNAYPGLTRRIVADGHELGVHTYTHVQLAATPAWQQRAELAATRAAIAAATGRQTRMMRPPYSSTPAAVTAADARAMARAGDDGYLSVLSDQDSEDWRRPGVQAIVRAATPTGGAGAVVMFHDGGGDRSQTVEALDGVLTALPAYRFTTVSTALRLAPAGEAPVGLRAQGHVLRWAQHTAARLSTAMSELLAAAVVLGALRLLLQLVYARRHLRRSRTARHRRQHFGLVSVVVPAYNEAANIAATLRSLTAGEYQPLEVIVVDDGSSDDTAAIAESLGLPQVRVIRQANAGKPAAVNTGVAAAHGDLLVLVDGDTAFAPDAVTRLVQPFADVSVGAVSGNTKVANRGGLLGRWQHLEYVIGFNLDRRMFDVARCMPTVPGAIGGFRRAALLQVGGVSQATLAEDTDLTMAVIRAGWRVVYEESAVAWTEVPATVSQLWRQRYRWCYGTMQAMWKHRRSLIEGGAGGRLGRRGLAYLLTFQVALPLTAPAVDVYAVYGLIFLPWWQVLAVWTGFQALQIFTAWYALRLDGERAGPLWSLPLQQIVYRQLMYLVVVHSTVAALLGNRQRWQRMHRTGQAGLGLTSREPPAADPIPAGPRPT